MNFDQVEHGFLKFFHEIAKATVFSPPVFELILVKVSHGRCPDV